MIMFKIKGIIFEMFLLLKVMTLLLRTNTCRIMVSFANAHEEILGNKV